MGFDMWITPIDISASGLKAQRVRMEIIANNIANLETTFADTRMENGYIRYIPYRRKVAIFKPNQMIEGKQYLGVSVPFVIDDLSDFRQEYNPEHPHSVKDPDAKDYGYVYYPNVNPIVEFVDMIEASRAYEANASAIEAFKTMSAATLRILG
jgi:flagellar basal-body rod protein FlgC